MTATGIAAIVVIVLTVAVGVSTRDVTISVKGICSSWRCFRVSRLHNEPQN